MQRQESKGKYVPKEEGTPPHFSSKLNTWLEREKQLSVERVRLVLIGKTGVGKSATGNTILGEKKFKSSASMISVTTKCVKKKTIIGTKMVQVIDTPGLFDTSVSSETIREEIGKCITMSSPGPHVFLLLISLGRFTQEERDTVRMVQEIFGEYSKAYTMVGFTKGDLLKEEDTDIEEYLKQSPAALQELIKDCGGHYHVFCNKDEDTRQKQVLSLLQKIDKMIQQNGGSFYSTAMYEETEAKISAREMQLLQEKLKELEKQANEDKDISSLMSEICKIKQTLERTLKGLRSITHRERNEEIKRLESIQDNLEKTHKMKINEMDSKIFEKLACAREGIRKKAEKIEAKAMAKGLNRTQNSCTIS